MKMIQGATARKPIILDQVGKGKFRVDDAYEAEWRIQAMTSWNDLVDEKIGLVEAICQNYEVLVEDEEKAKWKKCTSGGNKAKKCQLVEQQLINSRTWCEIWKLLKHTLKVLR